MLTANGQPSDLFIIFRSLSSSGQYDEALKSLQKQFETEKENIPRARLALAMGLTAYKANKKGTAVEYLNQALLMKTNMPDFASFYLGKIEKDYKNYEGARKHFEFVLKYRPTSVQTEDSEIEMAEIAKAQENWAEAYRWLSKVEKRSRRDVSHPEVLFDMAKASLKLKSHTKACQHAVALMVRYPQYAIKRNWDYRTVQAIVDTEVFKCPMTFKEREKRFRRLLLDGDFVRAGEELKIWNTLVAGTTSRNQKFELGRIETFVGELALADRRITDAIAAFKKAQEVMGGNFAAQMLLAKSYSQTDDYVSAVSNYLKAYQMSPRSLSGQRALFQAAFLSYQNRDYDGAARYFEDLIQKSRRRDLVNDSRWHLAWIRYLKSDYDGAIRSFSTLAKSRKMIRSTVDLEKITYWNGMSELRKGNVEAANGIFKLLASSKRMGYYAAAAQARLAVIPTTVTTPVVIQMASPPSASNAPSPEEKKNETNSSAGIVIGVERNLASTEDTVETEVSFDFDKDEEQIISDDKESLVAPFEIPLISSMRDPNLNLRFERARDLILMGLDSLAKLELREIEKRTKNVIYLQTLMTEYARVGDFFRSVYIADFRLGPKREADGIDGGYQLWAHAFPQAYNRVVQGASKKNDMPASLIWSVMRAESTFREQTHSGAGALGLMQLIPPTARRVAKELGLPEFSNAMLLNPETNITFGSRYLRRLNKSMNGNLPLIIASYNAGPHRVLGWLKDFGSLDFDEFIEHIPFLETRNYTKKVLRNLFVYQTLYDKKNNPLSWLSSKPTMKFSGPKPLSEQWD